MRTKHPDPETAIGWCTLANAVSYATHVLVVAMLLSQQQMIGLIFEPHYIIMVCVSFFVLCGLPTLSSVDAAVLLEVPRSQARLRRHVCMMSMMYTPRRLRFMSRCRVVIVQPW